MPLGEGLFDFCYADFTRMQQYAMYNCGGSYLLEPVSVPFEDTLYAALFPDRSRKTALLRALQKEYLNLLLLLDFDPLNRRNHYIDVIKQCGFKGRFSTYHIKTSMIKQEKSR